MSYLNNELHRLFAQLFLERMNNKHIVYCFECGGAMHEDTYKDLSTCYSHILGKKQYPEYKDDPENIEIVHPDCHTLYTMKPKEAKNQYKKYLLLKQQIENELSSN